MSESKISELTPEQQALIPIYREKWTKIALSTERINREKEAEAVKQAYDFVGEKQPKVLFLRSPVEILEKLHIWKKHNIEYKPINKIWKLITNLHDNIVETFYYLGNDCKFSNEAVHASFLDYYLNVLNISISQIENSQWEIYKSLVLNCGWIFFGKNACLVSERPLTLYFDNENLLHADAKPALEYADGIKVYAYHGMIIPEKYGKHHPKQWKPSWLLEEQNAELRKILIKEIGYYKIIEELQAVKIDSYQEYTLLKINSDVVIHSPPKKVIRK